MATIVFPLAVAVWPGCAVHYYDAETGVEHLIGFGHLRLKRPASDDQIKAVVTGVESAGVSMGRVGETSYANVGVHRREQIMVYDEDTVLSLDRPLGGGLFTAVIGSGVPESLEEVEPRTSVRADVQDDPEPQTSACANDRHEPEPRTSVRADVQDDSEPQASACATAEMSNDIASAGETRTSVRAEQRVRGHSTDKKSDSLGEDPPNQ